jgi:putative flippase GtrA
MSNHRTSSPEPATPDTPKPVSSAHSRPLHQHHLFREAGHFLRAHISSTVATGLEWVLVTALVLLRLHYLGAAAAGAVTGAFTDFSLKRHWAFNREEKDAIHRESLRYLGTAAASLVWNLAAAYVLVDGLGMRPVPGVIAASIVVGVLWNYPLHRLYVFPQPVRAVDLPDARDQRGAP